MARWIIPFALVLASAASFVAVHPRARSESLRLLSRNGSALFGPTADELHWRALVHAARGEQAAAEALCREALQAMPAHAPSRTLLAQMRYQEERLNAILVTCGWSPPWRPNRSPAALLVELSLGGGRDASAGRQAAHLCYGLPEIAAVYERGVRLWEAGSPDAAETEFRRILEFAKWLPEGVELDEACARAEEMIVLLRAAR
jgi:hypothetical protein